MSQSWRINDREIQYVNDALFNGFPGTSTVSYVKKLEELFAEKFDSKYAVSFTNGTATLHAALWAAGVGPGDEVIVPPLTMASTSYAVLYLGAIPVFADIDPQTFVISPTSIRAKVSSKTKAIIPVALYGLCPDMDAIMDIAQEFNLIVIEDDAQCFLGKYKGKTVGSLGHIASFSFQNSKHITCGEGGITITSGEGFAEKMRRFSSLGYGLVGAEAGKGKIDKSEIISPDFARHTDLGFNYRLSEICAAVAFAQLEKLEIFVDWRVKSAQAFEQAINGCSWLIAQKTPLSCEHSYWAYTLKLNTQAVEFCWKEFYNKFVELGGDGFYGAWRLTYDEPYFARHFSYAKGSCPNAERIQPQLIQLKTNYGNEEEIMKQAEILAHTIQFFESKRTKTTKEQSKELCFA